MACAAVATLLAPLPVRAQAQPQTQTPAPTAQPATDKPATSAADTPAPDKTGSDKTGSDKTGSDKTGSDKTGTVTVVGKAPSTRVSIDRRSYSLADDLQKSTGSLADVLRDIPSVDVDPQGNVSLRGDSNVTILVDGQPSALFQGSNRADMVQQLPADQYERVEVMTNPSAAFKPDGSGGIINLISKKHRPPNFSGTIRFNVDPTGRYYGNLSESYSASGLTLTGSAGFRHGQFSQDGAITRQITDPASGQIAQVDVNTHSKTNFFNWDLHGGVDYDLDPNTRLSGQLDYFGSDMRSVSSGAYRSSATSGALDQDYTSAGGGGDHWAYTQGGAGFLRKLGGDDHELSVHLDYSAYAGHPDDHSTLAYQAPIQPDLFQDVAQHHKQEATDLKAEYKGPMSGDAKLVVGYELDTDRAAFDNITSLGTSATTEIVTPLFSNLLKTNRIVQAVYATYQRPIGKFDIMPGLRLEAVQIDLDQVTTGEHDRQDYFKVYPTLHTDYRWSDDITLSASYSRRVQRPGLQQLNPFRVYSDPLNFSQGNPQLRPAVTDSYEAGYEYRHKSTSYTATLYYRDQHDGIENLSENLGGGAVLTTFGNVGHNRNAGLELVAAGEITKTLSYSATGDLHWIDIDTAGIGLPGSRQGTSTSGRATLKWSPTTADFIQFGFSLRGPTPIAQGRIAAYNQMNLGYRHKFDDRLSGVVTLQNPIQTPFRDTIDTPGLHESDRYDNHARRLFIGLTFALGKVGKAAENFDFSGGGASPH